MKKTTVLTILDGWGIGRQDRTNPIHVADPPTLKFISTHFPSASLQASGIAVGLPWGEEGNSEVSHLTIGGGRTLYQPYPRISLSIKDGSFFQNQELLNAFAHAKNNNSAVHLVGLLSEANIDSSLEHLRALTKLAESQSCPYWLHLITDGRDSNPHAAASLLKEFDPNRLASLSGRYYAMDEDEHWDRLRRFYDILTGNNQSLKNAADALARAYHKNLTDEYVEPTLIGSAPHFLKNNDAVIFFNFREDSSWEMVAPFLESDFSEFNLVPLSNLYLVTMTPYRSDYHLPVAFPQNPITNPLSRVFSDAGRLQLKIGETAKYAPLTYFFNGLREAPFKNEYRVFIPSDNLPNPDQNPSLKASDITSRALQSLNENAFDFLVINYANGDVIGHTGNFSAAVAAVTAVDNELKKLVDQVLSQDARLLIVGSHGKLEYLIDPRTGIPELNNTKNPVPVYLVDSRYRLPAPSPRGHIGILADIAPTILELSELPVPKDISGQSLLRYLI